MSNRTFLSLFVLTASLALSACVTTPEQTDAAKTDTTTSLVVKFINGSTANDQFTFDTVPGDPSDVDLDALRLACGASKLDAEGRMVQAFALGVLKNVLGSLVSSFVDNIGKRIDAELALYNANYSGSALIEFYDKSNTAVPTLAYPCFRFTKTVTAGKNESISVDLVGQFRLASTHSQNDALLIRPLRLYFDKPEAKSKDGHYGISIGITANSVWLQGSASKEAKIADNLPLASFAWKENGENLLWQVAIDEGDKFNPDQGWRQMPMVPMSTASWIKGFSGGSTDFAVTFVEVGNPPGSLLKLQEIFEANKEDLKTTLNALVDKALQKLQ